MTILIVGGGKMGMSHLARCAIVAGVPAHVVKWRFTEERILEHENLIR